MIFGGRRRGLGRVGPFRNSRQRRQFRRDMRRGGLAGAVIGMFMERAMRMVLSCLVIMIALAVLAGIMIISS